MEMEEKVKKAIKGDDNAFYEIIAERKVQLYRTAFTYVKNKEDALDIVSETVYKAYLSIKKLKEPLFFNTWLTRILINCSLDYIRKNKKVISFKEYDVIRDDTQFKNNDEAIDLHNALGKLNENCKTIVILKYFQDLTIKEVAEVLQCPIGTIKTNLHKALIELRINLKEEL
jgi:RNA polymerase sigma-70 factor (ECF subfamily)